jgi:hypothetical protein
LREPARQKKQPPHLEVDHDQEDDHGGQQVVDVGQVGAVEGLLERLHLVAARHEEVEQRDDRALELGAARAADGVGAEGLPDDGLADVGGDEQGDAAADAVALLEELVEADHDDAGKDELRDDQGGVDGAELAHVAVHAGHHVGHGLADGDEHAEQLLRALEQVAVRLDAVVDVDDLGPHQQLHHHAARHDGADAELHARSAV